MFNKKQLERIETKLNAIIDHLLFSDPPKESGVKKHKKHVFKKQCPECGKSFKGKKGVAKHIGMVHQKEDTPPTDKAPIKRFEKCKIESCYREAKIKGMCKHHYMKSYYLRKATETQSTPNLVG